MASNPFKPTAGKRPPVLIGREFVLDDFREALDNGAGAPGRLMLISGNRGYGKTVLLGEIKRIALERNWDVIVESAALGVTQRLIDALDNAGPHVKKLNINPSISVPGLISAKLGSAEIDVNGAQALTLREAINARLEQKAPGEGILIAIDEAQGGLADDMTLLGSTIQLVIGDQDAFDVPDEEKKGIAFVFAGLPSIVEDLQENRVLTFLRRAQKESLGEVMPADVRDAYMETVETAGKSISEETALAAALEGEGHPYLIQLVGYYMWRHAERRGSNEIDAADVRAGKADAMLAFYDAVCAPVYYGLRSPERLFVEAMAEDEQGFTKVSDIAKRCNRSTQWVAKYRASLIRQHMVDAVGYGQLRCVVPHLLEYIREKVVWHDPA